MKVTILKTRRFQGGSQTPKRSHLESLWGHFGVSFGRILKCFLYDCFKQNVMSLFKLVVTSGRIFAKAHLVNARVVKHFFYNAPALNALPVHLLRQVFFRSLGAPFSVFVFSEFFLHVLELSFTVLESIWEPFGGPGAHLFEPIFSSFFGVPFWRHFGSQNPSKMPGGPIPKIC